MDQLLLVYAGYSQTKRRHSSRLFHIWCHHCVERYKICLHNYSLLLFISVVWLSVHTVELYCASVQSLLLCTIHCCHYFVQHSFHDHLLLAPPCSSVSWFGKIPNLCPFLCRYCIVLSPQYLISSVVSLLCIVHIAWSLSLINSSTSINTTLSSRNHQQLEHFQWCTCLVFIS